MALGLVAPNAQASNGKRRQPNDQHAKTVGEVALSRPLNVARHESGEVSCGGQPVEGGDAHEKQPDKNCARNDDRLHVASPRTLSRTPWRKKSAPLTPSITYQ